MQWFRVVVVAACFACACCAAACATTPAGLTVTALDPGGLELRGARHLVVVAGAGDADKVGTLVVAAARGGYFTAQRSLAVVADIDRRALVLRIDAVTSTAEPVTITRDAVAVAGVRGRVAVDFSVVNAAGELVVDGRRIEQVVERPVADAVDVVGLAASASAAEIIAVITPRTTLQFLAFDEGDSGQASILGDDVSLADREQHLRAYIASRKGNAIAHFNLAVVLDAQQRFEEAMIEQDRALDLDLRPSFFDARSETIRRRDAWESVHGPRPPRIVAETPTTTPTVTTPSTEMTPAPPSLSAPAPTTMSPEPLTAPIGATGPLDDGELP